jgi:hypothetical protein
VGRMCWMGGRRRRVLDAIDSVLLRWTWFCLCVCDAMLGCAEKGLSRDVLWVGALAKDNPYIEAVISKILDS